MESNVSAQPASLVVDVKLTLMNAHRSHVTTVASAKIYLKAINANALQDTRASTVKKRNLIVATTLVQPEPCAKMNLELAITLVSVEADILASTAILQSIHAQQTEILVETELLVLRCSKEDSNAIAYQDGKDKLVKSTPMTAQRILAC